MNWYYADQGQQKGPIEEPELDELVRVGRLASSALVWHEGLANWKPYSIVKTSTAPLQNTAESPAIWLPRGVCTCCGRDVTTHNSVFAGPGLVCPGCKPVFVQRLREADLPSLPGALPYSTFWIRFTARMADYTLLTLVQAIFTGTTLVWALQRKQTDLGVFSAFGISALLGLVVSGLYESIMLAKRGATVGKMLCYIRVVHADGSPLSAGASVGRYFAELLSRFTAGIGLLMAAFDVERRALHDRIVGTRVIDVSPPSETPQPALQPVSREIRCGKCHTEIPFTGWNTLNPLPCPGCNTPVQAVVFPSIARELSNGTPQTKEGEGEAGCFYHDSSRATIACEECGRFLCALCDLDSGTRHVCPACFNSHTADPAFVPRRTLYDSIALIAALLPNLLLFTIYFTVFTAPAVIGFSIWSWKKQSSITPRGNWRFIVALLIAFINILFIGAGIIALTIGAFK